MQQSTKSMTEEQALLHAYEPGDYFLATPNRTILGKGVFSAIPENLEGQQLTDLPDRVMKKIADAIASGHANPLVVGAVPFDEAYPASLIIPETIQSSNTQETVYPPTFKYPVVDVNSIQSIPSSEAYKQSVASGIANIEAGALEKVVLSRTLSVSTTSQVDIKQLLYQLVRTSPQGYTFAVDLPPDGTAAQKTLIGSSPELLLSKTGAHVIANPLAGSRARSKDLGEDVRRAEELLHSPKDLHEHELVVQAVVAALQPFCKSLEVPTRPSLVSTETMWHLSTEIKGALTDMHTPSLILALALHPTPAICGSPTACAKKTILELEAFERGYFTGMVGWCDSKGDGDWIVTIRCAEAEGNTLKLFAGAGVVAGSKPEEELAETAAKFQTMLRAMGIEALTEKRDAGC